MAETMGKVYLVGAGPGDPGLLTLHGLEALHEAEVVIFDAAAAWALRHARSDAQRLGAQEQGEVQAISPAEIGATMARMANEGQVVCRLMSGDPFADGPGVEETHYLTAQGVPFEVVPGVTLAARAAAQTGARPLQGKRVLVTRARGQAENLSRLLERAGAEPIEFPVLRFQQIDVREMLRRWSAGGLCPFDWVLFTSANGVGFFFGQLREVGEDARWLGAAKVGAIGSGTAAALESWGIMADFVPSRFVAEAFAEEFPEDLRGKRVLLARAAQAREVLPRQLGERGAAVTVLPVYQTLPDGEGKEAIEQRLREGRLDAVTFASSSTVEYFLQLLPDAPLDTVVLACIGPITARTLRAHGREPEVVAEEHSMPGLVAALASYWTGR